MGVVDPLLADAFRAIVGAVNVVTEAEALYNYSHDETEELS